MTRNGYSEWSLKCLVNLDDTMMPLPKEWRIHSRFWCIALGEREEDSFMVIKSIAKAIQDLAEDFARSLISDQLTLMKAFHSLHLLLVLNIIKVPAVEESDLPSMDFFVHQKKRLSEVVTKSVVLVDESILHPYAQLELLHACSLLVHVSLCNSKPLRGI
ncbi:hypothetical protein Tco_1096621 [Tanacetum coccineum]